MKAAYLAYVHTAGPANGVVRRMLSQAAACRRHDIPLDFHLVVHDSGPAFDLVAQHRVQPAATKLRTLSRAYHALRDLAGEYDAVILRTVYRTPLFVSAFRDKPFKMVGEVHTLVLREHLSNRKYLFWLTERLSSRRCMNLYDGLIAMTHEIARSEQDHGYCRGSMAVIPNGIDVASVPSTGFARFDGPTLRLVMLYGAAAPWHGMDRIVDAIARYQGGTRLEFHLVGPRLPLALRSRRHYLVQHGLLHGQPLDDLLSTMHLAVSTLGLHRKGMREAASLKTRDYAARGLPFVYAYADPAVPEDFPLALRLPGGEAPLSLEQILDFATALSGLGEARETSRRLRDHAWQTMDWGAIMPQYMDLL